MAPASPTDVRRGYALPQGVTEILGSAPGSAFGL